MATVQVLADALLLTTSLAASTYEANTGGLTTHTLYVNYSPDTNSTNTMELRIDVSPDGTTWYPWSGAYADASSVLTQATPKVLTYTSDGTADQLQAPYVFSVAALKIRVRAVETNTPADYGNYTATLFSSRA
jgi:hypothetical protein